MLGIAKTKTTTLAEGYKLPNLIELQRITGLGNDDNPRFPPEAALESVGGEIFLKLAGMRIAKRQGKAWINLEPGYTVLDCNMGVLVEFALVTQQ